MISTSIPSLAIVSIDIRRDLILPMQGFTRLKLIHAYRQAPYSDLTDADLDNSLVKYSSPNSLKALLEQTHPDIVQNVEIFSLRQFSYVQTITNHASHHKIPLYAGVHISIPLRHKYGLPLALALKLLLQPTLRATQLFFYLNEGGKRNLHWLGVPEEKTIRLMYATWGIDLDEFTPTPDGREPNWNTPTILFIGRIHEEKGIFDLLDAFKQVKTSLPNVHLKLVGNGPHINEVKERIQTLLISDSCEILGTVKNRDLPPLLRATTIFTCPSQSNRKWEEYVGMTNIQAMACGVPVVTTRSGAIPEYVPEDAGILVPERDPTALGQAFLQLLKDPALRQQLGNAGRQTAIKNFHAINNVKRAEDELFKLL